ncbi:MAG: NAD(P)H-dependent oxidoreductase [Anaerolineales bacterium]|nr:NAD(P)H-dependent oxidoreductase [Anaerolineales bacterium]
MSSTICRILILYEHGDLVEILANAIAEGARSVPGVEVKVQWPRQTTKEDLIAAHALVIGTPNWTGIKGSLKLWLDTTGDLWEEGTLTGKIGAAFTASAGRHSGTEFTLLNVLHWFLGNGMIVVGLPWTSRMREAGSYYGATAIGRVTEDDLEQARALGKRVAELTLRLAA